MNSLKFIIIIFVCELLINRRYKMKKTIFKLFTFFLILNHRLYSLSKRARIVIIKIKTAKKQIKAFSLTSITSIRH